MRALCVFMEHHSIPKESDLPSSSDKSEVILSKIFNLMIQTLPIEKREMLYKESEEYCNGLFPSMR
jgi:hypothetical protein